MYGIIWRTDLNEDETRRQGLDRRWPGLVRGGGDDGFSQLPTRLLVHQRELGITGKELALIVQIASYMRGPGLPFPPVRALAYRMNVTEHSIRRLIHSLEEKGLISWLPSQMKPDGSGLKCRPFGFTGLNKKLGAIIDAVEAQSAFPSFTNIQGNSENDFDDDTPV